MTHLALQSPLLLTVKVMPFEAQAQKAQTPEKGETETMTSPSQTVALKLNGIRNSRGQIRILAFGAAKGFPDEPAKALTSHSVMAKEGELLLSLNLNSPTEKLALTVLHDENNDGKLNTNFLGIPKEGIGFSRDPNVWLGKPSFEDCVVTHKPGDLVTIEMKYF